LVSSRASVSREETLGFCRINVKNKSRSAFTKREPLGLVDSQDLPKLKIM